MDPQGREQLEATVTKLQAMADPRRAAAEWKSVLNLLRKTALDQNRVANVVARRSVSELVELLNKIEALPPPGGGDEPLPPGVDEQALTSAMKAFRKRLKFTRLDDESQINSRSPLSKGAGSPIRSIQPPFEWPREVWDTLVNRGKLRHTGKGFYELTDGDT